MNVVELQRALRQLRCSGIAATLEARLVEAQAEKLAPIDFLSRLIQDELLRRQDRLLERSLRTVVDVRFGEGALCRGDLRDRLLQCPLLRPAALENAGLVQVDVGFDKARHDQAASKILDRRIGRDRRRDLGDPASSNRNVERRALPAGNAGVA